MNIEQGAGYDFCPWSLHDNSVFEHPVGFQPIGLGMDWVHQHISHEVAPPYLGGRGGGWGGVGGG